MISNDWCLRWNCSCFCSRCPSWLNSSYRNGRFLCPLASLVMMDRNTGECWSPWKPDAFISHLNIATLMKPPQLINLLINSYYSNRNCLDYGHEMVVRGHPFMTSTKKSGFWLPPVHMGRTPPCGRPHADNMKYTPRSLEMVSTMTYRT